MSELNPDVPDRPIAVPPGPAMPQAATGSRDLLLLLGALPALVAILGTRDVTKIVAWVGSDTGLQVAGVLFAFGTMLWRQWLVRRQHADVRVMNLFTPAAVSVAVGSHEYLRRVAPRLLATIMGVVLALTMLVTLAGCATVPAPTTASVDRVAARYDRVKAYAELILPYVPADHAERIRLAGRIVERALAAARTAATVAELRAALAQAEAGTAKLDAIMDGPAT